MEQLQFKHIVLPLQKQLLMYSRNFLENTEDTEDIVQEVMMKLWCMRNELDKYESIPALAIQITKHLCLNRLKVLQRKMESLEHVTFESDIPAPDIRLEQKDEASHVMRIIDQLPELQQNILRMKHIDGFEIEEIVGITGCKPEAVRMNLSRARKKVREVFLKMQNK
jgi:RNA polymerase sigma-70 factor (ECF subfamily)